MSELRFSIDSKKFQLLSNVKGIHYLFQNELQGYQ